MQIIDIDSGEMEDFSVGLMSLQNRPVEAVGSSSKLSNWFPICSPLPIPGHAVGLPACASAHRAPLCWEASLCVGAGGMVKS